VVPVNGQYRQRNIEIFVVEVCWILFSIQSNVNQVFPVAKDVVPKRVETAVEAI